MSAPSFGQNFAQDNDEDPSLHEIAARNGLSFGAAVNTNIFTDSRYATLVARECGVLVAENHFKWGMLRNSPAHFDPAIADRIVTFAKSRKMRMRGHTLFFQEALPAWTLREIEKSTPEAVLTKHIELVASHFGDAVDSWDVMNEVVLVEDGRADGLRRNIFMDRIGPAYIDLAFHAARIAAPLAELVYNDWVAPYGGVYFNARRAKILALLKGLVTRNAPVDAFGVQSHLKAWQSDSDDRAWSRFLKDVADLGLKIHITELDVADQKLPADLQTRDRAVADATRNYLDVTLANRAVRDVLTWSLSDRYGAVALYMPRPDGLLPRALPFDEHNRPKLMRQALAQSLRAAPSR
jgi:endo-1,4-beta-xylanase